MLSPKTMATIKSTVPVLEVHGLEITKRFYEMLFTNHPELLNIFNHANQKQGRQQEALANAVYAAAKHIDQLEAILPVVKQVAHKHRSLGVKPEHYPIVGEHLIMAIKEVLGDDASEEILRAWEEAYGVIANVFIEVENEMYKEVAKQPGGWDKERVFVVDRKEHESDVITSFYLKPVDGKPIASFKSGQYISIKVEIPGDEFTHIRQYSLSDVPEKPYYRISVKKEESASKPDGIVSNYIHDHVNENDKLSITAPAGDFYLNEESTPIVLLSGGVGITPMLSMLKSSAIQDRKTTFIHASLNGSVHAFHEEVTNLKHPSLNYFVCYESPTQEDLNNRTYHKEGFVDYEWLSEILSLDPKTHYYFCGPLPFMKAVKEALEKLGVSETQIHYEFFGPAVALEASME
ncbi:NO-inducible flavohemoprotein [Bacillus sp. NTK071]|uniref:NO-inducible flavohemoprotein n=1 Tax=Bacillus sp. NTK071 TaxID=2802175 RepID=UPI001A907157|nr:NO-inducible flavohemoprotein [Bacillus sp. NTK071]MBN8208383.1 NO-inducible flavohemoprotein [Bacillus sp. NTK071]